MTQKTGLPFALAFLLGQAVLLAPPSAHGQAEVPGGESLIEWLGLQAGDQLTYANPDGERVCVEVGSAVTLGGRRYAPLIGLPWPGLASDSQVFLPLDVTLGVGVIRTPSLRPAEAFDWLLAPQEPRFLPRIILGEPAAVPGDGWYVIGDSLEAPTKLLHVWCIACVDAGTTVWLEKGRGITRIEERTIAGPQTTVLIAEGCEPMGGLEVEVYVSPPPERRP